MRARRSGAGELAGHRPAVFERLLEQFRLLVAEDPRGAELIRLHDPPPGRL